MPPGIVSPSLTNLNRSLTFQLDVFFKYMVVPDSLLEEINLKTPVGSSLHLGSSCPLVSFTVGQHMWETPMVKSRSFLHEMVTYVFSMFIFIFKKKIFLIPDWFEGGLGGPKPIS